MAAVQTVPSVDNRHNTPHTHTYKETRNHTHVHTPMYTCLHAYTYICSHVCLYICQNGIMGGINSGHCQRGELQEEEAVGERERERKWGYPVTRTLISLTFIGFGDHLHLMPKQSRPKCFKVIQMQQVWRTHNRKMICPLEPRKMTVIKVFFGFLGLPAPRIGHNLLSSVALLKPKLCLSSTTSRSS